MSFLSSFRVARSSSQLSWFLQGVYFDPTVLESLNFLLFLCETAFVAWATSSRVGKSCSCYRLASLQRFSSFYKAPSTLMLTISVPGA
jgi:hypothetical protein